MQLVGLETVLEGLTLAIVGVGHGKYGEDLGKQALVGICLLPRLVQCLELWVVGAEEFEGLGTEVMEDVLVRIRVRSDSSAGR